MWNRFHLLSLRQVFVVACLSALLIAMSVALASIPPDGRSMNRFLAPSPEFDPLVNSGPAFIAVIAVLIGYYHWRSLGASVGIAVSGVSFLLTRAFADAVFGLELLGRSVLVQTAAYLVACLLIAALIFVAHVRATKHYCR